MALKKNPNPTFKHPVEIPVPGEKPEKVEFTFKHKSKSEYKKYIESCVERDDPDNALEIVADWKLTETFGEVSKSAFEELFEAYPGAPGAILSAFVSGLFKGRLGN